MLHEGVEPSSSDSKSDILSVKLTERGLPSKRLGGFKAVVSTGQLVNLGRFELPLEAF